MLIDMGASSTCMAVDVAQQLGLTKVGFQKTYGAGGLHTSPIFEAHFTLEIVDSFGNSTKIESFRQVAGIPDLDKAINPAQLITPDGFPPRLIGLLGREFLRHATFTYHGARGVIDMVIDLASLK